MAPGSDWWDKGRRWSGGHHKGEAAVSFATRTRISRRGRIRGSRCQEPVTRVAPQRPKRQGGDRQPRRCDCGLEGERANASHPSQVSLGPLSGLGEPETPGEELDCRVTQNRDVLISLADVGSRPPALVPGREPFVAPLPSGPRAFKSQPSNL